MGKYNDHLKKVEYRNYKEHKTSDGKVLEVVQDVSDIVERNKKEYNNSSTKWGDDMFDNKIASIPNTVIDDLNHKKIMHGYDVIDMKRFKEFLNHPDNRFFRTKQGRI